MRCRCRNGSGLFKGCVRAPSELPNVIPRGACGNCHYNCNAGYCDEAVPHEYGKALYQKKKPRLEQEEAARENQEAAKNNQEDSNNTNDTDIDAAAAASDKRGQLDCGNENNDTNTNTNTSKQQYKNRDKAKKSTFKYYNNALQTQTSPVVEKQYIDRATQTETHRRRGRRAAVYADSNNRFFIRSAVAIIAITNGHHQ